MNLAQLTDTQLERLLTESFERFDGYGNHAHTTPAEQAGVAAQLARVQAEYERRGL